MDSAGYARLAVDTLMNIYKETLLYSPPNPRLCGQLLLAQNAVVLADLERQDELTAKRVENLRGASGDDAE